MGIFSNDYPDRTEKRQARPGMWNGLCSDISKSTLVRGHHEVLGYDLTVDPTTHKGALLEKSEENAVDFLCAVSGIPTE